MKKSKIARVLPICLCAGALLAGCGGPNALNASMSVVKVEAAELQAPVYGEQDPAAATAAKGANDFAFRLSAALAGKAGDENFICSPYSVWAPLAALVNATGAQSKPALLEALGAPGGGEADINRAASRMLYDLTKSRDKEFAEEYHESYHNPFKIANAIFVSKDETLRRDFAQTFMDFYRGNAINVDFGSDDAVRAVNRWASENTDGLITDLVREFDPETVAAIANAIYFSDRWQWEFDPEETAEGVFHAPTGDQTAFYMLREGSAQTYYEDDQVQAMPLRFKTGGGLYVILPKDGGAAALLSAMTDDYFDEIQRDSIQATGKLLLPRFSIESDVMELGETLSALGVQLFDKAAAPLTDGLIEADIPVWLTNAVQKAVIHVDEKGTTAAAVTVMPAAGAGMPLPAEPFEMVCDTPFVFVLYERTYDGGSQVLFTGIVNQP
jgi:serpin B